MSPRVKLRNSREKKKDTFENFIESYGVHSIEDSLRHRLIEQKNKLSRLETLLIARILWGRNLNALNENNGQLDLRHLKAEVINISCLLIYIRENKNYLTNDLLKLLIYHTKIIKEHLEYIDGIESMHYYDIHHYEYCVEWFKNCIIILDNNECDQEYISSKIEQIKNIIKTKKKICIDFNNENLRESINRMTINEFL
jgi:hypothetical protein